MWSEFDFDPCRFLVTLGLRKTEAGFLKLTWKISLNENMNCVFQILG